MKQLRKMTSHELNVERKRNAELCKKLHEANLKLKALQNPDTPSKCFTVKHPFPIRKFVRKNTKPSRLF